MRKQDLHLGLEVAVRDSWKSIEHGEIVGVTQETGKAGLRYTVELQTGRSRGKKMSVASRSILYRWEDYEPTYESERRKVVHQEAERLMAEQTRTEKTDQLQIVREHLMVFGIMAAMGNLYVPGQGYDPALFIRFEHCLTLDHLISRLAEQELLGPVKQSDQESGRTPDEKR